MRKQFCERMLFDLLCKFHCSVRGVSLIPHCIAAGIGEKRDPFGRKHTFTYLDFRGPEVIDPQCGRHAPLGTPFRYSYFWVIRSKDDDFLATSTVFCVRLHAPAVNRFRFRPGVEITVRAVVTFEFAYFLFIHRFFTFLQSKSNSQHTYKNSLQTHLAGDEIILHPPMEYFFCGSALCPNCHQSFRAYVVLSAFGQTP